MHVLLPKKSPHTHTLVCVVDHSLFLVSYPPNLVDWPSIHLDNVGPLIGICWFMIALPVGFMVDIAYYSWMVYR